MYTKPDSRPQVETFLGENFVLVHAEEVPHQPTAGLLNPPLIWRYFLRVPPFPTPNPAPPPQFPLPRAGEGQGGGQGEEEEQGLDEADYVVDKVMEVNTANQGAYIYGSGKNVGVFKGVGHPQQIAEYFGLEEYQGYIWTAHTRFPTNTPGWWGGAHPFGLLDWTVVHNGEISSYGTNRRYLEMQGYHCTMHTDTEVMAYAADFLMRRHNLPVEVAAKIMAPPLWVEIRRMGPEEQALCCILRQVYASLLVNGPFTVIIARQGEMIGLTDRIRLRPLTAAIGDDRLYLSSEEASIRLVCPQPQRVWTPVGGEPIVGRLGVPLQVEKTPVPEKVTLSIEVPALAYAV